MKILINIALVLLVSACSGDKKQVQQADNKTIDQAINQANSEVTIAGSHTKILYSDIVKQEYKLLINLPAGYEQSTEPFPVVFVLDAQWDFTMLTSIYGQQYFDGFVPGFITVGVTWGGDNPNPNVLRRRDFTPTDIDNDGKSGNAANFLAFFEQELIPYVNKEYKASNNRTLMGSSLGGLFTLYAMFNKPELFQGYMPSSAAVPWDNNALYSYAEGFNDKIAQNPSRLFLAVSELEGLNEPVKKFVAFLDEKNYSGLTWNSHIVMGAGHSGVKAEGNTRGLQYIFKRDNIALSEDELAPYLGNYQSKNRKLSIKFESGQLIATTPSNNSWLLNIHDKSHFYHKGSFMNVEIEYDREGNIKGLTQGTYGNNRYFEKVAD